MDGLTRPLNLTLVGLGILLTLILGPTGWLFRNLADNLLYGKLSESQALEPNSFLCVQARPQDKTNSFLYPLSSVQEADAYANRLNTPVALAQDLIRHYQSNLWRQDGPAGLQATRAMLDIANRGHAADPDNGFFTFAQAQCLWQLHQRTTALIDLQAASDSKVFEDYTGSDAQERISSIEKRWGYPGEATFLSVEASILFPHFSSMKATYKDIMASNPDAKTRLAMVRFTGLMNEHCATIIQGLVATGMANIVLRKPGTTPSRDIRERGNYFRTQAAALQKELATSGLSLSEMSPSEIVDHQQRFAQASQTYVDETLKSTPFQSREPAFQAAVFGKILGLLGLAALTCAWVSWLITRIGVPELYPFAAALLVQMVSLHWAGQSLFSCAVLSMGGTLTFLFSRSKGGGKFAWVMSALTAVLLWGIFYTQAGGESHALQTSILSASIFSACLVGGIPKRLQWAIAIVLVPLLILALNYGWRSVPPISSFGADIDLTDEQVALLHGTVLSFCLYASLVIGIIPYRLIGYRRFGSWAFLATMVFLLSATVGDIRLNEELRTWRLQMLDEANIVRATAGL